MKTTEGDASAAGARGALTQEEVRRLALALPGTREGAHHGRADLRVGDRIFATLPEDGRTVNVKASPTDVAMLAARDPVSFRDAWGGRWLGVDLERVEPALIRDLLLDAWSLAAPKALARAHRASLEGGIP